MGDTNSLSPGAEGGGSSSLAGITEACCLGEPWYGCGVAGGRVTLAAVGALQGILKLGYFLNPKTITPLRRHILYQVMSKR